MGRREANAEASWCDCNICLDVAKHPALTLCGHLYCSACIETWLRMGRNTCPVCKAPCDRAITIYGRGRQGPGPNGRSIGTAGVAGRTKAQSGWPGRRNARRQHAREKPTARATPVWHLHFRLHAHELTIRADRASHPRSSNSKRVTVKVTFSHPPTHLNKLTTRSLRDAPRC